MTAANYSQVSTIPETGLPELVVERTFNAPRDLVFQVWTDPRHVAEWWGPEHFDNPVCELDPRPGGAILIHMRAPDGAVYPMTGTFEEVVPPERLVFSAAAIDENGAPYLEDRTTVTFTEEGGKTKMTLRAAITRATPEAAGALGGMEEGWNQSLDKLTAYLERQG
jgi:uncharacterized protein YndB with AHSA1/START domain